MKGKAIVGIMVTLILITTLFYAIPNVAAKPDIKIGIIGPVGWTVGDGMWKGAQLAAAQINLAGGVLGHNIVLEGLADTLLDPILGYVPDPTPATGTRAMTELVDAGCDFAIGGFRSEAVIGARVVSADEKLIYFITGAATDFLVDDGPGGATDTVREDYGRWKYLFRNTPINSTMLVRSLVGLYAYGIKGFIARLLEDKLVKLYPTDLWDPHPVYGGQIPAVKFAVISEAPVWADGIHAALTSFPTYAYLMGPFAKLVYESRVSAVADDVTTELGEAVAAGARLIIHILSGPVGLAFTNQWMTDIPAADRPIIVGINVPGQEQPDHWTATGGKAEYEAFLATAGTRSPMNTIGPNKMTDYWDTYTTTYDEAPIYTSYTVYDVVMQIAETITAFGHWPPVDQADYDLLIPIIEQTERYALPSWFKYTGPHPGPGYEFLAQNPTMKGGLHDIWMNPIDLGTTSTGWSRAVVAQWQGPEEIQPEFPPGTPACGRLEVVCPEDVLYCRRFMLPPWYYRLDGVDINVDGEVNLDDALLLVAAFFSNPGDPNWNIEADIVVDGDTNLLDALYMVGLFFESEPIPYPS